MTPQSDMRAAGRLQQFRRIVVKIGSALLVDRDSGELNREWLKALADDLNRIAGTGAELLVVSSGAIALGRSVLRLPKASLRLEESQAAAAAGQIALARAYSEALGAHDLSTGQILLTLGDTEERRRYLNARSTLTTLLKLRAVPIVNENDTVATSEIRYGDNDRLAARVASMISADLLVLLSDVDGLYSAPPDQNPDARFIADVPAITPSVEAYAGDAGSDLSRGGMRTKIDAAKIATAAGTTMVIASGRLLHPLREIDEGGRATWFHAKSNPVTARKKWIAGHLETRGSVRIDEGAKQALKKGKSLLPAGVTGIAGGFLRGDAVRLIGPDGREVGRGLVAYDHAAAEQLIGCNSREIEAILGYAGRAAMIHRDDLVIGEEQTETQNKSRAAAEG